VPEKKPDSDVLKELVWSKDNNAAAKLSDRARALPFTEETACRERGNVCRICQLLIGDFELNA
jgi:hypothetical protein